MKTHHYLLSLGTSLALTLSTASQSPAAPEDSKSFFSFPNRTAEKETIRITPSIDSSQPPTIQIREREDETGATEFGARESFESTQPKRTRPALKVTVPPSGTIPLGIDFIEVEDEDPAPLASIDDRETTEYGAASRTIDDPLLYVWNASQLLETPVQSEGGEQLGTIQDFIVDKRNGRIELIAVGPGDELHLIPPQALEADADRNELRLDLDQSKWEEAPTVAASDLEQISVADRADEIYSFYQVNYRPRAGETMRQTASAESEEAETAAGAADLRSPRGHPSALTRSSTRSEQAEKAGDEALKTVRENSSGPSLHQARLHQSARGTDRTPNNPLFSESGESDETEYGARPESRRETAGQTDENRFWVSEIRGADIETSNGEPFAYISDLIADLHVGYVQHLIITLNDENGESYAVPLDQLEIRNGNEIEFLGSEGSLSEAPEFEPRMARLHRYEPFSYNFQQENIQYGAPEQPREPAADADDLEDLNQLDAEIDESVQEEESGIRQTDP